jgi:hypothetical protein
VNAGLSIESLTELNLKNENASDLGEYYLILKEIFAEIIKLSTNLITSKKNWREHAKLYNELSKIVDLIPYTIIKDFYD